MEFYIPKCYIEKERIRERTREIQKLRLPEDIINKILNYDEFINIDSCMDTFWIKFGKETCNLSLWECYCYNILTNSFGKKKFKFMIMDFYSLKAKLDSLVCESYPLDIYYIKDIYITSIFYGTENIEKYHLKNNDRKKYITKDEQIYIKTFIKRINKYLKFIENNINKLTKEYMKKYPYSSIKNEIIKIISEFKLKSDKLSKMMEEESDGEMYYEEECGKLIKIILY